jgi:hypothetical protein
MNEHIQQEMKEDRGEEIAAALRPTDACFDVVRFEDNLT